MEILKQAVWLLTLTAGLGFWSVGCSCGRSSEDESLRVFSEHRLIEAEDATKDLGEDCTTGGASDCRSGVCLHYGANPSSRYACSRRCVKTADCDGLEGWRCASVYPSPGASFCTPPSTWVTP